MMKSFRTKSQVNRPPELVLTLLQVLIGHSRKKRKSRSLRMRCEPTAVSLPLQLNLRFRHLSRKFSTLYTTDPCAESGRGAHLIADVMVYSNCPENEFKEDST
jgi:hypothetical protein